ncbi:choline/ethanolaminephosphotransferase 1 [Phtheirospermum japonicum]|uniref:Choline/ethanolaminephosphotransferase 1 n=1 Tax=Phtheirospermum japonicum TaxID=374723 RepID=A0A830CX83_9LAMI|nr:choline/ethanolaminephosphotransferase 1 [Phtheirospermum japonicum]
MELRLCIGTSTVEWITLMLPSMCCSPSGNTVFIYSPFGCRKYILHLWGSCFWLRLHYLDIYIHLSWTHLRQDGFILRMDCFSSCIKYAQVPLVLFLTSICYCFVVELSYI